MTTRGTATALAGLLALIGLLAVPRVAAAELRQTSGIVAELGVSVHGLTETGYAESHGVELDPLIGLSMAVLGRPYPWFSAGVILHYGFLYAQSDAYEEEGSGFFSFLVGVRGHVPFWILEPWLGFGMGYALAHTYGSGDWPVGEARGHVSLHGIGFGLDGGIGVYVTDNLHIGPFFRLIFGIYPTACRDYDLETAIGGIEDEGCDAAEDVYGDTDLPHSWSVGVALANTF
jgi:hypothetical protein